MNSAAHRKTYLLAIAAISPCLILLLSFVSCNTPLKTIPDQDTISPTDSSSTPATAPSILIFGFTPYHGESTNVSEIALQNIDYPGAVTRLLDTAYSATDTIVEAISVLQPDYAVLLGQNEDDIIWLNRRADNLIDSYWADNEGVKIRGSEVIVGGPSELYSDLPVEIETNIPYRILSGEGSAGDFVCNAVYYRLLYDQPNYDYQAVMIHLPRNNREQSDRFVQDYLDALQP